MESISIVLPTRNRPKALTEFLDSINLTTRHKDRVEVCMYIDEDDEVSVPHLERIKHAYPFNISYCIGKQGAHKQSQCGWDEAYKRVANNSIIMMAADDFRFRQRSDKSWDEVVFEMFDRYPDRMILLYGDDGFVSKKLEIPTFHFIHRRWIEALPFWCPPYFTVDYVDTWQGDIAAKIRRKIYTDDLFIEHMHFLIRKSPFDQAAYDRIMEEKRLEINKRLYYSKEKEEERSRYANILSQLISDR